MTLNTLAISNLSTLAGELIPLNCAFFEQLFDALSEGVYLIDRERKILYWNRGAEMLTGYSREETVGRFCNSGILDHLDANGCHLCEGNCPLVKVVETGQTHSKRVFFRHKDRRRMAVTIHALPLKNEEEEIIGAIAVFRDASAAVALEYAYNKLRELSVKDTLTGVAHRPHLHKTFKDQLALLKRTGICFSVILLEIDDFQQINDSHGRAVSDKTLIYFAQLLQRQCHGTDIIGRFGKEKFLILLRQQHLESAVQLAERLRIAIPASMPEELRQRGLSASFGVIEASIDDTTNSLLKRLTRALQQSKSNGGNRVEAMESTMI